MINCGMAGSQSFYELTVELVQRASNRDFIIICGNNKALFNLFKLKLGDKENCLIYGYVENMIDFYKMSDLCITKPGANTLFESLLTETIPLIFDLEGLMYQEKGVHKYLAEEIGLELRFENKECLIRYIVEELNWEKVLKNKRIISNYTQYDASNEIVKMILDDYQNITNGFYDVEE